MPFHKKFYVFWNSQKNNYGTIQSVKSTASCKLMIGKGLKSPGWFTVSWYTFLDTVFFDEKSMIQAILRYMSHPKCAGLQI